MKNLFVIIGKCRIYLNLRSRKNKVELYNTLYS